MVARSFDESSVEHIKEQLKKDAMHNDIPMFCHDSRDRTVLYNGIVIGRYVGKNFLVLTGLGFKCFYTRKKFGFVRGCFGLNVKG